MGNPGLFLPIMALEMPEYPCNSSITWKDFYNAHHEEGCELGPFLLETFEGPTTVELLSYGQYIE